MPPINRTARLLITTPNQSIEFRCRFMQLVSSYEFLPAARPSGSYRVTALTAFVHQRKNECQSKHPCLWCLIYHEKISGKPRREKGSPFPQSEEMAYFIQADCTACHSAR